ncbi:phosphatase PAP2 family protein [Chlorella virus XW01]|nr:phosphatase PAP2 family protein [Chlorella virus XW01]
MNEIYLNYYLQNNQYSKHFYNISLFISNIFNTKPLLILLIILYFYKLLSINQIIQFLLFTVLIIFIKYIIKRHRPFTTNKNIKNLDNSKLDTYSFPSGHMFTSSLLMLILYKNSQKSIYNQNLKILLPIIPLLVGFSRIILGVHYLTDVIASYLFANFIFLYLLRLNINE